MKLTVSQIQEKLTRVSGWELANQEISKLYKFGNFIEAMRFVNNVADEAEKVDHHPDILINYNQVTLTLSTHSEGVRKVMDLQTMILNCDDSINDVSEFESQVLTCCPR